MVLFVIFSLRLTVYAVSSFLSYLFACMISRFHLPVSFMRYCHVLSSFPYLIINVQDIERVLVHNVPNVPSFYTSIYACVLS